MGDIAAVLFGSLVYLIFLATFLYAVAFVDQLPVPKTIDSLTPGVMAESIRQPGFDREG